MNQNLSRKNFDELSAVFRTVVLDSTIARDLVTITNALFPAFLLARQIPLPATAQLTLTASFLSPGLQLLPGDRIILRDGQLQISNNALPVGSAPFILIFSVDPASFSAQ